MRKAVRDFWQERTRSALVVLAIALGIAGFSGVLSAYAILTRELNDGYLATQPASATLWLESVDDELSRAVVSSGRGVRAAEARRSVSGRIKTGPVAWRALQLFVIRDFSDIRVSTISSEDGAWPPATGELLIERDALQVAKAAIGESVTVRTARGGERTLRVAGSVHDVGQAQARMENVVYGYVTLETLELLGEERRLDQLKILADGDAFDEAHVRKVAAGVEAWLTAQGRPVRRMEVPTPGAHPHAALMGMLLLAMAGFGCFALGLSGVLVVNLVTALMAAQLRQIGVMKAVGGTRARIAAIYLGQASFLGVAALAVALPVGLVGGRALCRYMAVFLNFDLDNLSVPAWVYLLDACVALLVPLLAAAWPVWKGTSASVREALDDFGVSRNAFGTGAFDRALAGAGGLGRPLLLAVRNGFRRRGRLALSVVSLSAAGVFFMSALSIRSSLVHTLDRLFDAMKFDLSVGLGQMQPWERIATALESTAGISRAEGWIATEASLAEPEPAAGAGAHAAGAAGDARGGGPHAAAAGGDGFRVVALPAETKLLVPEVVKGRALVAGDADAIVVNAQLADRYPQLEVGREVSLRMGDRTLAWTVVGVVREPFVPAGAYVPKRHFERQGGLGDVTNSLRLALERNDPASIERARAALDAALEREQVRGASSSAKGDGRYSFDQHMLMIYVFLLVMAGILAGVGGLGQATSMSLNVLERRREMGVLRAIGATPRFVWLIVVCEGVAIGLLSWALAAVLAWPVSRLAGDAMVLAMFRTPLDFRFETGGVLIWLGVSVAIGAVSSLVPAWHASRRPVREAIAYE
ncbi:MAG: ABC transporter permease [Vicinamibacteria bacterium]